MRKKRKVTEVRKTFATPLLGKMRYKEAANYLGVSERTLQKWVKLGTVPHYRIGRKVYFEESRLLEFVESCRVGGLNG